MRGCTCHGPELCPVCQAWADKATQLSTPVLRVIQSSAKITSPPAVSPATRALPIPHGIGGARVMDTTQSTIPLFVELPYKTPLLRAEQVLCQATIHGNPVTKARARFYDGKVYTPKKTRLGEQAVQWALKAAYGDAEPNRIDDLGISALFYTQTRQRSDLDNFLKLLMDACNGLIWGDDVQVVELSSKVIRGDARPRVDVLIYRVSLETVPPCETCGKPVRQIGKIVKRKTGARFCSKPCYDIAQQRGRYVFCSTCKARLYRQNDDLHQENWYCSSTCRSLGLREQRLCRWCQQAFSAPKSYRIRGRGSFCTPVCRQAWHAQHRMPSQKKGVCRDCGEPCSLQKHRASRCHPCYLRNIAS